MKPKNDYVTVKLPVQSIIQVDDIKERGGFTSRTDVIKYAVRQLYNSEISR